MYNDRNPKNVKILVFLNHWGSNKLTTLDEAKSIIDQIFEKTFDNIQNSKSFDKPTISSLKDLSQNKGFNNPESIKKILQSFKEATK